MPRRRGSKSFGEQCPPLSAAGYGRRVAGESLWQLQLCGEGLAGDCKRPSAAYMGDFTRSGLGLGLACIDILGCSALNRDSVVVVLTNTTHS